MPNVFLSYRRSDSEPVTARIHDQLAQQFGAEQVFVDTQNIDGGVAFQTRIRQQLEAGGIVLAIIGPQWIEEIRRRTENAAEDHVRFEIETALSFGLTVVPVLVEGASVPTKNELPASLHPLVDRNAVVVRPNPDFKQDVAKLIQLIWQQATPAERLARNWKRYRYLILGTLLLFVLAFSLYQWQSTFNSRSYVQVIDADPEGWGAKQVIHLENDPSARSESIESVERLADTNEFRVILKKGFNDGWFKAIHINRTNNTKYLVQYWVDIRKEPRCEKIEEE